MSEDASGVEPEMDDPDGTGDVDAADADEGGDATREPAADQEVDAPARTELVEDVAAHDEDLADEVEQLQDRIDDLGERLDDREARIEELESKLKRKQADFQNYKKRAERRREEIEERATEDLVERLVPVRDNLLRALEQDGDADIRGGVESTLEEFDRVLAAEDVAPIEPDPGSDVDPSRHQVMMRVESDQPEDTIAEVYRPGYEMAGKVIQEAQVTVSEGSGEDGEGDDGDDEADVGEDGDDEAE